MLSSKEIKKSFRKVKRSYKTPLGWRLATFQEVKDNLESIEEKDLPQGTDIARLLDGWISGPCDNFQMGNNFRYCIGYMLVTQAYTQANSSSGRELYEDVSLTEEGKQVALLLCAYDWNYEVVYWLLNSWDTYTTEKMDPHNLRDGEIPFNNAKETTELNKLINDLATNLCETSLGNKGSNKKVTLGLVTEVLKELGTSSVENLTEYQTKKLLGRSFKNYISFFSQEVANYWFRAFETQRDSENVLWDLTWEHFCTFSVVYPTQTCLGIVIKKWFEEDSRQPTMSQRNFILSGSILYYISLLHKTFLLEGKRGTYKSDEKFIRITCDENFNVLDQILLVAAKEGDVIIIKKMLDCGAHALSQTPKKSTALHVAFREIEEGDKLEEVVNILMSKCGAKGQLINAQDEGGKTILHSAALKGNAKMCKLLLDNGAKQDAKDHTGRLPLHYAVEEENDEAIDVLISFSDQKSIEGTDNDGKSPFDLAVDQNNIKLMAKLLPILNKPLESYFNKVDTSRLLRQFAFVGDTKIVGELLGRGASPLDVDEVGRTALHYAAMCENYSRGLETIDMILDKCEDCEQLISKRDKKGKTALHTMALKGVPYLEPEKFVGSVDVEDIDGRGPLYDATQGEPDEPDTIDVIMELMEEKDISLDNMVDNTGLTPLHVAASQGKVFQVDTLLNNSNNPKIYVKRADYLGQTALHKAAKGGHEDTIKVLLHWGAQPLLERDCDGKTALHYAVQAKTGKGGIAMAELLLKKCGSKERQLLFLWASAAGTGRADQNLSDPILKEFLLNKREELTKGVDNLLRPAACMGDTEMTKELLRSGCQIASIQDEDWTKDLKPKERLNVQKVLDEIQKIAEQGNDRPSILDNLGRAEFAHGLAALLLNPYLKPPIAIGISGSWGMGKSSLMVQTEIILLKTAAQSALLPTSKSPSSNLPGVQEFELSKVGQKKYNKITRWVDFLRHKSKFRTAFISPIIENFRMWIGALTNRKSIESQRKQPEDSLVKFLNNYEPEYHNIFKSLAAIDSSDMFIPIGSQSYSRSDSPQEGGVPAILTVQYNAWKYRNESEALAGMAVEITKEMEGIMTGPQWLSTCLRNTWRKQKKTILIEVIFPCLLAIFLAGAFTWIVWLLLDRYNVKEGDKLMYASLPATIVIMVWTLVKTVMSAVNPVSTQLMSYIKFPDHTENLGYQERVISDINFLKGEIREKPYFLCTAGSCIWHLITRCCLISYLCPKFSEEDIGNSIAASTSASYASNNVRIIVFVDDLDRCEESVILQVLSAINLVLAVCEISAVVGMDKALIQRAIIRKYGDESMEDNKELVDKYLQKIIQLPLDLPDPSEDESKTFLERQLGVFGKQLKDEDGVSEQDAPDHSESEDQDYDALFSTFEIEDEIEDLADHLKEMFSSDELMSDASLSRETKAVIQMERESHPQTDARGEIAIDVTNANNANAKNCGERSLIQNSEKSPVGTQAGDQSSSPSIQIRKMLFVRYSEGEQDVFRYFETMDTDWRKLPRQWKCLLYYHRLIWYIFSMSDEAKSLDGWQVQLITWIFICWEWEKNVNILIQNWDRIDILKNYSSESESDSGSVGPSLRAIVENYRQSEDKDESMSDTVEDKHKTDDLKGKDVSKKSTEDIKVEKSQEDLKGKGISKNMENPESSRRKPVQLEATDNKGMVTMPDYQGDVFERSGEGDTASEKSGGTEESDVSSNVEDDDDCGKTEMDKLKEVVKDQMISGTDGESNNRGISEKLDDVVKTLRNEIEKALIELAEMKKEIRDLKETKQQNGMNNKSDEIEQTREKNWRRMKTALKRYDVSMKGIQAFQRFRFYCVPGYLPWPLPKEETEDS